MGFEIVYAKGLAYGGRRKTGGGAGSGSGEAGVEAGELSKLWRRGSTGREVAERPASGTWDGGLQSGYKS